MVVTMTVADILAIGFAGGLACLILAGMAYERVMHSSRRKHEDES